jgi:phospholipid/cholesterol/gamma-HCH transport system ATP-binding protein
VTSVIEASQPSDKNETGKVLVQGRGLSIRFDHFKVLDNLNFDLFEKESLVLIGPSGQGKTTLLKVIAGLVEPTTGQLDFEGENWSKLSITQRNRHFRKRGMLFQKNALFDSMTALQNVSFPLLETTEESTTAIEKKALQLLEDVGLGQAAGLFPDEMSGGMQKRLGIARALILRPPLLLNDDPVAGLDPITSKKIIQLLLLLRKETGLTMVSVLNDMNRAFELATRILYVSRGGVLDLGGPEEARQTKDLEVQAFLKGTKS